MNSNKIIFRFDDISASSDTLLENEIFETFLAYKIPLTVGVIPFECAGDVHIPAPQGELPLPPSKFSHLLELQNRGFEIAQHGLSHQVREDCDFRTEFIGREFTDQWERLDRGKRFLEQHLDVESFIPPWNGYDKSTIKALESLGFRSISADPYGCVMPDSCLQYMPASVILSELIRSINASLSCPAPSKLIVVLLHSYEFHESKSGISFLSLNDLRRLLAGIPFGKGIACSTFRDCASSGLYSARAFLSGRMRSRLFRILPSILRERYAPDGVSIYPRVRRAAGGRDSGGTGTAK